MNHVTRIMADGTQVLEPAIGEDVNVDNAIVDRFFAMTDAQRRNTDRYIVTNADGQLVDSYGITRNPYDGTYRIRLAWAIT